MIMKKNIVIKKLDVILDDKLKKIMILRDNYMNKTVL